MPWLHAKQNYFEIISVFYFTCKTRLKLFQPLKFFQNDFRGLLQLVNIFQYVQFRGNYFEIISDVDVQCNYFSVLFHM